MKKQIHLIPYMCGAGAQETGCVAGAAAVKKFGLDSYLTDEERSVTWQQDPGALYEQVKPLYESLPPLGSKERAQIVLDQCKKISDEVEKCIKEGAMPVTIGGDHSMAAGSIAGFARGMNAHGRIGLIWVDAHTDINTLRTSPSGALHGMPVAALLKLKMIDPAFSKIAGNKRVIEPQHIVYAGLRSVDDMEKVRIRKHRISAFTIDTEATSHGETFLEAVARVAGDTDYLVLSFDMDAVDPTLAPSVGSPEADGFRGEKILPLLGALAAKHSFDMVEIAEFNPALPGAKQTYDVLRDVADIVVR